MVKHSGYFTFPVCFYLLSGYFYFRPKKLGRCGKPKQRQETPESFMLAGLRELVFCECGGKNGAQLLPLAPKADFYWPGKTSRSLHQQKKQTLQSPHKPVATVVSQPSATVSHSHPCRPLVLLPLPPHGQGP
jgi:hypothetical protein